jgi:hypothetical protein
MLRSVCASIARTNAPRQGADTKRSWHLYQAPLLPIEPGALEKQ